MYFDHFPTTTFNLSTTNAVVVTDFIRAIKLDPVLKDDPRMFTIYSAQNGETPEIISHKFYKTTEYHWVIMLLNDKFNPYRDFPQHDTIVVATAMGKYHDIYATHHHEDSNGNVVDQFYPNATPITNIEYERGANEETRTMKIMRKEVLPQFVDSYQSLIAK